MENNIIEIEKRRRINVCLWAYAYEVKDNPLVTDEVFDEQCQLVDISVNTDNPTLDEWFKKEFKPYTGQWIHTHPEIDKLNLLYNRVSRL